MKKFACVTLSAFMMLTFIVGLAACNKDNSEGNVVVTYIQGDRDKPTIEVSIINADKVTQTNFFISISPIIIFRRQIAYLGFYFTILIL